MKEWPRLWKAAVSPCKQKLTRNIFGEDMNEMAMEITRPLRESSSANPETSGYAMWTFWPIDTHTYMTKKYYERFSLVN